MLRAEWLNAAVQPGMAVVYRFSDRGLTGKSQFLPHGYRRLYTARRPAPVPGTDLPGYAAVVYRHQRMPRDRPPAGRQRQSLPDHRPDTVPARYDKPASRDSCRHTDLPPDAPSRRLPGRHMSGSLPAPRKGFCTRCTHQRSCRLSCTASRPSAPSHLSWRTSPAYRHICRFRG